MPIPLKEAFDLYAEAFGKHPLDEPDSERRGFLTSLYRYCEMLPRPCRVVEIGTYRGCSAAIMACALRGTGSQIICIDPVFETGERWCADSCPEKRVRYASELRNVVNRWSRMGVSHMISVIPTDSASALWRWDGSPIDLVLVDGEHSREAVTVDSGWSKFVRPGGYVAYDDWIEEVRSAAMEYFKDKPEWELLYQSTDKPPDEHPQWAITLYQRRLNGQTQLSRT